MPLTYHADKSDEEFARWERRRSRFIKVTGILGWVFAVIIVVSILVLVVLSNL